MKKFRWAYITSGALETWVAYVTGTPAGYFELELQANGNVEIVQLGLLPQFIGQGLGGALVSAAVRRAWAAGATRVWLHTCSFDHPYALNGYKARGFNIFKTVHAMQEVPEKPPGPWPGALPDIM
jgi:GNAT superfamily N-acetyltransferase